MDSSSYSSYALPLTREGYRQWILRLHSPLVVIIATEEAQNDLRRACRGDQSSQNQDVGEQVSGGRPLFASLFAPFGSLPGTYNANSETMTSAITMPSISQQNRQFGCPQNVNVRIFDKVRNIDVFPVRFSDVSACVPIPTNTADVRLLKALEDNLPSLNALRVIHRLHPHSVRKGEPSSSPLKESFQLVEEKGISSYHHSPTQVDHESHFSATQQPSSQASQPQGSFSNVSSKYPHAELRSSDTFKKSYANQATLPFQKTTSNNGMFGNTHLPIRIGMETEAEIYDQLYLTAPNDSSAISSAAMVPCIWWDAWTETLCRSLDFLEMESLGLPLGFIFVASTSDTDPAAAFEELGQRNSLPPICRQQLADSSAVRAYVLIHTSSPDNEGWSAENDDRRVSEAFGSVCSSFPPSSCHILMFRPIQKPTVGSITALLHAHFDSIQTVIHTIISRSVIPFMERVVKRLGDQLTFQRKGLRSHLRSLWGGRRSRAPNGASATTTATGIAESALDTTADLLWGAVTGGDDGTSTKKDKSSKSEAAQLLSVELQGRLFADLLFLLGDYAQAAVAYRNAANDFRHARAVKQLASASEMLGITLCLSGGLRNDMESAFNQSLQSYLECNCIRLALRSQIYCCRALLCLDSVFYGKDVALKFDRLSCDVVAQEAYPGLCASSNEPEQAQKQIWMRSCSARAALLLEQAAICFGLSGSRFSRKMQFFLVLAGHTFNKSGFKRHALRCYSMVIGHLGNSKWNFISDHLLFSSARQTFSLGIYGDSFLLFTNLLNSLVLQATSSQFVSVPSPSSYSSTFQQHSIEMSSTLPVPVIMSALRTIQNEPQHLSLGSLPQPLGTKWKLTTTSNRETTYLKEFLFVFKTWYQQIETYLESQDSIESKTCLKGFRALRIELNIPTIQNINRISVLIEGDELPQSEKDHLIRNDYMQVYTGHTSFLLLAESMNIPISPLEQKELMWLSRCISSESKLVTSSPNSKSDQTDFFELRGTLSRTTATDSLIIVEVELTNPLKIPLECSNLGMYGKLIESRTVTPCDIAKKNASLSASFLSWRELFQMSEDPCVVDQDPAVVQFLLQQVRFEANETKLLKFYVIPKKPGRLYLMGLRWDLYGSVKAYKPVFLYGRRKPIKDVISVEMSPDSLSPPSELMHSVLPGRLPSSNPLAQCLENEPLEGPLSPLPHEWITEQSTLTPSKIARQAILISQLCSQSIERARTAIHYFNDLRFQIDISAEIPRITYRFVSWPESPLFLGQRVETPKLIIQNIGKVEISKICIVATPRQFVFFSDSFSSNTFTTASHTYVSSALLPPGNCIQIPLTLRGTSGGRQSIGFCVLAESSPFRSTSYTDLLIPATSVRSVLGRQTSDEFPRPVSAFPLSESNKIKQGRKWLLIEKNLSVVPGIHVHLGHHASWQESGRYVAVCQIDNQVSLQHLNSIIQMETTQHNKNLSQLNLSRTSSNELPPLDWGQMHTKDESSKPGDSESLTLRITKVQGFLTCADDTQKTPSTTSPLLQFKPIELMSLASNPTEDVIVPFGKSVQLVYICNPFGSLPFDGWKSLKQQQTDQDDSKITMNLSLLRIFTVVRTAELERQAFDTSSLKQHKLKHVSPGMIENQHRKGQTKLGKAGPMVDFLVSWEIRIASGDCIAQGDHFVHQIPFFLAAAACPLKFQIHPSERVVALDSLSNTVQQRPQGLLLQNIQLTLQNISSTDTLSVVLEADTEASARGLSIQHYQTSSGAKIVNAAVKAKDVPAFLGTAANRFPASGGFLVGQICFSLKELQPGEIFSTSLSYLSPRAGVNNLNKFRFIIQSRDKENNTVEKIFAFPFQSLLYHRPRLPIHLMSNISGLSSAASSVNASVPISSCIMLSNELSLDAPTPISSHTNTPSTTMEVSSLVACSTQIKDCEEPLSNLSLQHTGFSNSLVSSSFVRFRTTNRRRIFHEPRVDDRIPITQITVLLFFFLDDCFCMVKRLLRYSASRAFSNFAADIANKPQYNGKKKKLHPSKVIKVAKPEDNSFTVGSHNANGKSEDDERSQQNTADYLYRNIDLCQWVVFKDSDYIVINKPPQVPVLDEACRSISIEKSLGQLCYSLSTPPYLCHLIDTEESGILLLARSREIRDVVLDRLRNGTFWNRQLIAVVDGRRLNGSGGWIRMPLVSSSALNELLVPGSNNGEQQITQWKVLNYHRESKLALIQLNPTSPSGCLKHQVRAHCAYGLGCPIIGDVKYTLLSHRWCIAKGLSSKTQLPQPLQSTLLRERLLLHLHHCRVQFESADRDLILIHCGLPYHMTRTFQKLRWKEPQFPQTKSTSTKLILSDTEDISNDSNDSVVSQYSSSKSIDDIDVEIEKILSAKPLRQHPLVMMNDDNVDKSQQSYNSTFKATKINFPDLR